MNFTMVVNDEPDNVPGNWGDEDDGGETMR